MIVKHVKSFHSYCPFFQTITSSGIELDICICRQGCLKDVIVILGFGTQTQNLDSDLISIYKRLHVIQSITVSHKMLVTNC